MITMTVPLLINNKKKRFLQDFFEPHVVKGQGLNPYVTPCSPQWISVLVTVSVSCEKKGVIFLFTNIY